ncbi:MAG: recombinase family protein [Myxococcaceae bacterium]
MKVAACYVRVSTEEQTTENQRAEVERLAKSRGYEPRFYEETGSAVKHRPVFDAMMKDVRAGHVQAVCVWALDRVHRNMHRLVADVAELARLNVRLLSVKESFVDVEGPMRDLFVAIFGWFAQFERDRLRERTKAGLERARRQGKTLGRPRVPSPSLQLAVEGVRRGQSIKVAARSVRVSESSLRRALKASSAGTTSAGASSGSAGPGAA